MEGNFRSEAPPRSADVGCAEELNRSSSDASALTAENCKDILHPSSDARLDDSKTWTDEKHSLYLEYLEVSFVKHLHQSMGLLAPYSEQNKRDKDISQMRTIGVHNTLEQYGCQEKVNCKGRDPVSHASVDSRAPLNRPGAYRFKRMGMHCPSVSADLPELFTVCGTEICRKGIISHGSETCSHHFSADSQFHGDSYGLMREGSDQNFVDEDNQYKSNPMSRAKRLKTALTDSSSHDQVSCHGTRIEGTFAIQVKVISEDEVLHIFQTFPDGNVPSTSYSSPSSNSNNKIWSKFVPVLVGLVVVAEILFLGPLDMAKDGDILNSGDEPFYHSTVTKPSPEYSELGQDRGFEAEDGCQLWLEKVDSVPYSRDFEKDPIFIAGYQEELKSCAVKCTYGYESGKKPDAVIGVPQESATNVLRSMESAVYYAENDIAMARRKGYSVVMTTSLSSDVPVGYFSWAEYDIMAPVQPKTESALAAAFISNCGARNFRLQALVALENANITIDSYGGCHHNRDGREVLSCGYWCPNIQDFAPSPGSVLHINEVKDVNSVAKRMKYLAENPSAYNESLRSDNLTLDAMSSAVLLKFKYLKHIPVWKPERPESLKGGDEFKIYRIYPIGKTQRQALYSFRFEGDSDFRNHIESHPCAKFEVILV
ncbi:putative fucosyltransferase-like protein [Sesamum angolense]|uniref:Fucosyltransferase-like protein n=1 Tax=Sesamum angolense TaxID=2727404 RepID=A0AAE2C1E4_9LAMI|nr:putative fucosyltransferase-like protein [Sesamum angolense]